MATRKQAIEVIEKWLEEVKWDEDDDFDIDDELEFFLNEYLNEYDLCEGCRCYYSPDRTCERLTDSLQRCINRVYKHWVDNHRHKGAK